MPYQLLMGFAVYFLCVKLMEWKVPFWLAAILFVAANLLGLEMFALFKYYIDIWHEVIRLGAALVVFFVLDRLSEAMWEYFAAFIAGWIVLIALL